LKQKYDVIAYANTDLALREQIHGIDTKLGPIAYTSAPEFPSHGQPDASDDITGGIGWTGMANLQRFLDEGGLLITLGNGSALALEGGLVRGVSSAPSASTVWTPGVELRATFDRPEHPLAYGYPKATSVFRDALPVYTVRKVDRRWIVLQWGSLPPKEERGETADDAKPGDGAKAAPLVVSGGAKGEDVLEGRPAILDMPAGKGHVIAFNFNPQHRDLNRSDYRLLWNAIINWKAIVTPTM
jgi:hypothetical protein